MGSNTKGKGMNLALCMVFIRLEQGGITMDIKAKIEKLLVKTVDNGCTMAEATAAAKMAQELVKKYHIELAEVGNEVV
jgi:hypothetical protein